MKIKVYFACALILCVYCVYRCAREYFKPDAREVFAFEKSDDTKKESLFDICDDLLED